MSIIENTGRVVAVIPARGGSKRLPRKNVLPFRGKPLISWTIEAVLGSKVFTDSMVSTEDDEIARISRACGIDVRNRPPELADDVSRIVDVVNYELRALGLRKGELCILLPNCPLRGEFHIRESLRQFRAQQPAGLLSVVGYGWTPPFRALSETGHGLDFTFGRQYLQKSQSYPDSVCPSGAIYWTRIERFLEEPEFYSDGLAGYTMPWHDAIDIDEKYDLQLAEAMAVALQAGVTLGD